MQEGAMGWTSRESKENQIELQALASISRTSKSLTQGSAAFPNSSLACTAA
jgi:hypothetical protein